MTLASDLQTDALSLINEFGGSVTYTRPGAATYNRATSKTAAGTPTVKTIKAHFEDLRGETWQGCQVTARDKKAYIAASALGFEPKHGDTIKKGAVLFTFAEGCGKKTTEVNGVDVLYELQVRA